jgi:metal-responsive CopG/Arc/MetJ family transcriptional regulator
MTLPVELVEHVDRAVRRLKTNRSAFTRDALRAALARLREEQLERRHRAGYGAKPARRGEFDVWESEHAWGDE